MVTKAQTKAKIKYETKAYDKVLLRIRKDGELTREDIQQAATAAGESLNEYILNSIRERMNNTTAKG